jgi:hypothetical protein
VYVEYYKAGFENDVAGWKSFGAGLLDDGFPNSHSRSAIIRKVLYGDWQEAYADWIKLGEYWTEEEVFLGFILACEVVVHRRPSAPVPDLPMRVWDEVEYRTWLKQYDDDEFWFHICERLTTPETTPWLHQRNEFIKLLGAGKATEAEAFYYSHDWDQYRFAESDLALIHMCAFILGDWNESEKLWFYADALHRIRGPIRMQAIQYALKSGDMPRGTYVCTDGMPCWQPAAQIAGFVS